MNKLSILFLFIFTPFLLNAENATLESEPEILFQYKRLKVDQSTVALQVDFNKAILFLEKEEYKKAIPLLKKTAKILEVPSFLNLGIAYYKLKSIDNAKLYLEKIYNLKKIKKEDTFSYMSSAYYLYLINNKNEKYLNKIIKIGRKYKSLDEHSLRMLADTFILLKEYEKALKILDFMDFPQYLKKAIIYIKLKDYEKADVLLNKAFLNTINKEKLNTILWLKIFRDLKSNEISKLDEHLDDLNKIKEDFEVNKKLPLKMYFNRNKFTPNKYFEKITKFDIKRKVNLIFYFAPFVFSDNDEIIYDSTKGFIYNSNQNLKSLDNMITYNKDFIKHIKDDPIVRIKKLKEIIKSNPKSYVYYNLALSYGQISDFHNAYKNFRIAYKLNPGNKLYAAFVLISAKQINKRVPDKEYIEASILSKKGIYRYFGQNIYKFIINPTLKIRIPKSPKKYENSIFHKFIVYLKDSNKNKIKKDEPLFEEHLKDPLVNMLKMLYREKDENDYEYFSRLQDNMPLKFNHNFLSGPLIVTQFYIDFLKALGLFEKAELNIEGDKSPSYLRTKALRDLYEKNPESSIKILEFLQKEYKMEDKYSLYLYVAALLEAGKYNEASIQITLIKTILQDSGADFLTGVQLIQELKIISAKQYFKEIYLDSLIDFKLEGLNKYLESL